MNFLNEDKGGTTDDPIVFGFDKEVERDLFTEMWDNVQGEVGRQESPFGSGVSSCRCLFRQPMMLKRQLAGQVWSLMEKA